MGQTDRSTGLVGYSGCKIPVRLASTANVPLLNGLLTIDGVVTVQDDRVLLKDQTTQSQNGIWIADTGDWVRAQDCDGPYDLRKGSLVFVNEGAANASNWYYCTATDPIIIGTDAVTFAKSSTALAVISAFWQSIVALTTDTASRAALSAAKLVITTKGDLFVGGAAGAEARKAVGINGKMLVADSSQADGLLYAFKCIPPGGRLTLATATPVTTADQSGKTTVFYTPYKHDTIELYDGTGWIPLQFAELSQLTTDTTKSPAAVANNSNYDVFVWNDAGTLRATRGPAWTSDTARGAGAGTTELELFEGRYVNKIAITNGPAARRGLYVGSIRSDGSAQINDAMAKRHVWNNQNRTLRAARNAPETADSWTYTTATIRQANNNAANQLDILVGLDEDEVSAAVVAFGYNSTIGNGLQVLIGLDSTTAMVSGCLTNSITAPVSSYRVPLMAEWRGYPGIGRHTLTWLEVADAGGTATWEGDSGQPASRQSGIHGEICA